LNCPHDVLDFRPSPEIAKIILVTFPPQFLLSQKQKIAVWRLWRVGYGKISKKGKRTQGKYAVKAKNQICPLIRSQHQKSVSNSVECDWVSSSQTP
jgi:hypothetical protein